MQDEELGFSFKPLSKLFLSVLPVQNFHLAGSKIGLGLPQLVRMPLWTFKCLLIGSKIAPEGLDDFQLLVARQLAEFGDAHGGKRSRGCGSRKGSFWLTRSEFLQLEWSCDALLLKPHFLHGPFLYETWPDCFLQL